MPDTHFESKLQIFYLDFVHHIYPQLSSLNQLERRHYLMTNDPRFHNCINLQYSI